MDDVALARRLIPLPGWCSPTVAAAAASYGHAGAAVALAGLAWQP